MDGERGRWFVASVFLGLVTLNPVQSLETCLLVKRFFGEDLAPITRILVPVAVRLEDASVVSSLCCWVGT